jgi:IclR family transcriptional regulator, pca regulon regulatory protein
MPRTRVQSAESGEWYVPSLREPRFSQSLERGLAILGCFTADRPMLGIADIADGLGMSRSTTHRYVITLVALGYLEQGSDRKYRLGLKVTDLGMSALNATGLREHAHPVLEELREQSTFSTSIAVLDGVEIVYVDRTSGWRRGQNGIDLSPGLGSRLPAYRTALGKVLLAHLPDEQMRDRLSQTTLKRGGPYTITSKRELQRELQRIREVGLALEDQERTSELVAIAAPVHDDTHTVIAAIDITTDTSTLSIQELSRTLGPHLLTAADRISVRLGHRRG